MDAIDGGCFVRNARREAHEESKLAWDERTLLRQCTRRRNGSVRYVMHGVRRNRPVLLPIVRPAEIRTHTLNRIIAHDNADLTLDHPLREMDDVRWINVVHPPDNVRLSELADGMLRHITDAARQQESDLAE